MIRQRVVTCYIDRTFPLLPAIVRHSLPFARRLDRLRYSPYFNIVAGNHTLVYRPSTNKRKLSRSDQRIAKKFRHRARVSSVGDGRGWRDTRERFATHFNGGRAPVGGFRSFSIGGGSSLIFDFLHRLAFDLTPCEADQGFS